MLQRGLRCPAHIGRQVHCQPYPALQGVATCSQRADVLLSSPARLLSRQKLPDAEFFQAANWVTNKAYAEKQIALSHKAKIRVMPLRVKARMIVIAVYLQHL